MSPVSKKRRPEKRRPHKHRAPVLADRGLVNDHLAELCRSMRPLCTDVDPLRSEAYVSGLVAALMNRDDADEDESVVLGFLDSLTERSDTESLGIALAMSEVAPTSRTRHAASTTASSIATAGAVPPKWAEHLGHARPLQVYELADGFGDQTTIMCTFDGPDDPHALVTFINLSHPGGFITDIVLTTSIAKALNGFERFADDARSLTRLTTLSTETAAAILIPAVAESYRCADAPEAVAELRPLLSARLTQLAGISGEIATARAESDDPMVAVIADAPSDRLPALRAWRDFGVDYDAGRTARLSPTKIEAFAETFEGSADDAAAALRRVLALHDGSDLPRLSPRVQDLVSAAIDATFPTAKGFAIDTSWLDELVQA